MMFLCKAFLRFLCCQYIHTAVRFPKITWIVRCIYVYGNRFDLFRWLCRSSCSGRGGDSVVGMLIGGGCPPGLVGDGEPYRKFPRSSTQQKANARASLLFTTHFCSAYVSLSTFACSPCSVAISPSLSLLVVIFAPVGCLFLLFDLQDHAFCSQAFPVLIVLTIRF